MPMFYNADWQVYMCSECGFATNEPDGRDYIHAWKPVDDTDMADCLICGENEYSSNMPCKGRLTGQANEHKRER